MISAPTTSAPVRLADRARAWLAKPRSLAWCVALGVLLASTSLGAGLVFDDYLFVIDRKSVV